MSFVAGSSSGFINGIGSAARFNDPLGMTFQGGAIYVSDYTNHAIRHVTPSGAVTAPFGNGSPGFVDATGTAARFRNPTGIAKVNNVLYVADSGNHRIRKIDLVTNAVTTYAGSGADGSGNAEASLAQFSFPTGVAVSPSGAVYVVESNAGRIRKIE